MVSMPKNICNECYQKFTAAIDSDKVRSGSINIYCRHHAVLLAGELHDGLLIDWMILPCASQEHGYKLVESIRRELVNVITGAVNKALASSESRH